MKLLSKTLTFSSLVLCTFAGVFQANSEIIRVGVDPAKTWNGYMNVFDLGGGYLWGSGWGAADLTAVFSGSALTLGPNVNCYNPADPYWVNPDGSGNKRMNANFYVEDTSLVGQTINFSGLTLANTLVSPYTSQAFIKVLDPGAGWATVAQVYVPLVGGEAFSLSLTVGATPGLVPQYGFVTDGLVANPATVASLGSVQIAVPEPSSLALLGLGALAMIWRRRQ